MKKLILPIFLIIGIALSVGCIKAPEKECSLSLCDCKCHEKGQTPEELNKKICGINCMAEYGVSGCELIDGKCVEITVEKLEEVTVTTDKKEYGQNESVRITITNNLKESIYSHIGTTTPKFSIKNVERKKDGEWEKLFAYCQYPNCRYDMDPPKEIKTGQSESFVWNPIIHIDGGKDGVQAGQGEYRLSILYRPESEGDWKSAYSNEFRII